MLLISLVFHSNLQNLHEIVLNSFSLILYYIIFCNKHINTIIKWTCVGGGAVIGFMIGPNLPSKAILGIAGGVGGYYASTLLPDMSKLFDDAADVIEDVGEWAKGAAGDVDKWAKGAVDDVDKWAQGVAGDVGKSFDDVGDFFIGKGVRGILGKKRNIPKTKIKPPPIPKRKFKTVKIPKLQFKLW